MPAPALGEWPKLDVATHRLARLALAWTLPYGAEAESHFGQLLDDDGAFAGVLSYSRRSVPHYRVEAAQLSAAEDGSGALLVTVQYQADTGSLLEIPKSMQDRAWLVEPLQSLSLNPPVLCHADVAYENSSRLTTSPALPIRPPEDNQDPPYDEIFGVSGVKHAIAGDEALGYTFALDRLPTGDIVLALDFVLYSLPAAEAPERALDVAASIAGELVKESRK